MFAMVLNAPLRKTQRGRERSVRKKYSYNGKFNQL